MARTDPYDRRYAMSHGSHTTEDFMRRLQATIVYQSGAFIAGGLLYAGLRVHLKLCKVAGDMNST